MPLEYNMSWDYVRFRKKPKLAQKKFKFEFSRKNLNSRATVHLKIYTRYYEVPIWGGYVPPPDGNRCPPLLIMAVVVGVVGRVEV